MSKRKDQSETKIKNIYKIDDHDTSDEEVTLTLK